jgi:hypothetical protein
VKGLNRYDIKDPPICQPIPENIRNITINLNYSDPQVPGADLDFDLQIKTALDSYKKLNNPLLQIEDSLFKSKLTGDFTSSLAKTMNISRFFDLLELDLYSTLGSRVHYYMENGVMHICTTETALRRLLGWWAKQTPEQKAVYNQNHR